MRTKTEKRRGHRIVAWARLTDREWRAVRALASREERSVAAQVGLIVRRYLRGDLVEFWKAGDERK